MAIKFLNNLDLQHLEVKNLRIENLPSAPSTGNSDGDLLFNSTTNKFGYYNGSSWVYPNTEGVTVSSSTFVDVVNNGTATVPNIAVSLSASGSASAAKFLRGDNVWGNISDIYSWTAQADTGTATINNGNSIDFEGGTNVTTTLAGGKLTINSTDQYQGTVTGITLGDGMYNAGNTITTSGDVKIEYIGADNYIMTRSAGTPISTASIAYNDANGNLVKRVALSSLPVTALSSVKTYIDNATAGGVVWQSGYNAGTNSPDLDSATNVEIKKGYMYTVTNDGLFFTEQVRVGDTIIANEDMAASGGSALNKWTVIQSNVDFATAGTTASATRGISAYDSNDFTVSATGFVELKTPGGSLSKRVTLNSANSGVSVASVGGVTTYTVNVASTAIFGSGATAINVMAEVIDGTSGSTVYVESTRGGANLGLKFLTSPSEGDYHVLLHKVG